MNRTRAAWLCILVLPLLLGPLALAQDNLGAPAPQPVKAEPTGSFTITFDPSVLSHPYTGRVYIILTKMARPEPRYRIPEWFGSHQLLSLDVKDVAPGGSVTLGSNALSWPAPYADAASGDLYAQALARVSLDSPTPGSGEGDLYSEPASVSFKPGGSGTLEFKLTHAVTARPFKESDRVKLFNLQSPSLSAHYGRPFTMHAGVILPEGWTDDPSRHYPTLYFIGGFGGTHLAAQNIVRIAATDPNAKNILWVVPDPTCPLGHSVFADSANNGPWGKALMEELIPAIEAKFHGSGDGAHRYVAGMSSGGWSSLWLQITYPDAFAGCWAHCPDPVDFRDFQRINLYADGANMYRDAKGQRRPLARELVGGEEKVSLWFDSFVLMETVLGPGGQIHSFEAVFSPRGPDGNPVPLFDRATGAVDPATAKAWEKYDIRMILERNWATLGPKLKGKLHIFAGGTDTFYLEGAARLLKESLEKFGSDAQVVIIPGMSHRIHQPAMTEMFAAIMGQPAPPPAQPPAPQPALQPVAPK